MERDMSARKIYGEEETPEGAAGSEFGKKQREEARRKKFGIVTREFKVEDQPWILKVNGKAGKRWVERLAWNYSSKVLAIQDKIMYYKSYYLEKSQWLDVCKGFHVRKVKAVQCISFYCLPPSVYACAFFFFF